MDYSQYCSWAWCHGNMEGECMRAREKERERQSPLTDCLCVKTILPIPFALKHKSGDGSLYDQLHTSSHTRTTPHTAYNVPSGPGPTSAISLRTSQRTSPTEAHLFPERWNRPAYPLPQFSILARTLLKDIKRREITWPFLLRSEFCLDYLLPYMVECKALLITSTAADLSTSKQKRVQKQFTCNGGHKPNYCQW